MNLFVFNDDPVACAKALDNLRVGKMLMETNQMMSTAILQHSPGAQNQVGPGKLGKATHINHPITKWVGQTSANFDWALQYAYALRDEHAYRYNGKIHGSALRLPTIESLKHVIPEGELTLFQNSARNDSLQLDFTDLPVFEAYRKYISTRWNIAKRLPQWNNRLQPTWYRS